MNFCNSARHFFDIQSPLLTISAVTITCFAVSVFSLISGWQTIFQNLFYIPIIISCAIYTRRGFVFSIFLAFSYFFLMLVFSRDPSVIEGAFIRVIMFILVAGVITYLSEIRIGAENALRNSERRLSDIIDFLPDATFAIDNDGVIIAWNRAMEEMTGISHEIMIGKGNYEYAMKVYGERKPVLIDETLGKSGDIKMDYSNVTKKGKRITAEIFSPILNSGKGEYLWINASPLINESGEICGAIESIRPITEIKRTEDALVAVNKKMNLLGSITRHDALNKLTILSAYLQRTKKIVFEPTAVEYLKKAEIALLGINRQLEFTREYQDLGRYEPVWQNLETPVKHVLDQFDLSAILVKLELNDLEIFADPMLPKVFSNFIDNSLRYGEKVTEFRIGFTKSEAGVVVFFEDNGIGIPESEKAVIFDRGYGKNTGLGLFLIREILSITGITIRENGKPKECARFEMTVPIGMYRFIRIPNTIRSE